MDKTLVKIPERFKDHPIFNERMCGTNFGFMSRRGYYDLPETKKQPELMRAAGINWTTLNMNYCQTNFFTDKIFLDFDLSSNENEVGEMVKRLHDNGIMVMLKPNLMLLDGAWMGRVRFPRVEDCNIIQGAAIDYWGKWFKSFTECSKYFSSLAEKFGVDAMMIGCELHGTEGENEHWEKVIEVIRNNFSGPITYEFTPASRKAYNLAWFEKLDFLSYSYYPPAAPPFADPLPARANLHNHPSYTVEQMVDYLACRKQKIADISARFNNMPIAFTEYGVRSSHGSIMHPAEGLWDSYYDGEEQANFMEASFRTFWDIPQWMGFLWWKWDETQYRPQYHDDPAGDKGFTIQGKPAEAVMKKWLEKAKQG